MHSDLPTLGVVVTEHCLHVCAVTHPLFISHIYFKTAIYHNNYFQVKEDHQTSKVLEANFTEKLENQCLLHYDHVQIMF